MSSCYGNYLLICGFTCNAYAIRKLHFSCPFGQGKMVCCAHWHQFCLIWDSRFRDSLEFTLTVHAIQSNHQISTYSLLTVSEKYTQDKKLEDSKWEALKEKRTALKETEQAEEETPKKTRPVHRGDDNHLSLSVIWFLSFISVCFPESKMKKYMCKCR